MTHTNLSASLNASTNGQSEATEFPVDRSAIAAMSTGLKKTALRCGWRLYDLNRGRVAEPFGAMPEMTDEIIDAGGQYHYVARPWQQMLAHIRRRCRSKLPDDMKPVIESMKKECDEAEARALVLAFSGNLQSVSDLAAFDKEADEAILALEKAKEIAQDKIAEATR